MGKFVAFSLGGRLCVVVVLCHFILADETALQLHLFAFGVFFDLLRLFLS
jgi:hypothetical protein